MRREAVKNAERTEARRLRATLGVPMKQIASQLGVSPGTVHAWTRDIEIPPEQAARNKRAGWEAARGVWSAYNRELRAEAQRKGRREARAGDELHLMGCMLYWAEGSKERNACTFANSDLRMMRTFRGFLWDSMGVEDADIRMRINVYLGSGSTIEVIEEHWLSELDLPASCLRAHQIDHFPTSSSGKRKNKLRYGVCTLRVSNTYLVQRIFGAIQEYTGINQPHWLDCDTLDPGAPIDWDRLALRL